ncbi:MAG: class I SAM-dependent methyltransferase [Candidatus Acidiferrales bacterium]
MATFDLLKQWCSRMDAAAELRWHLTDRFLNAFHYPVARATAHYYPNYEGEVIRFLHMIMRHCERHSVVLDAGCGRAGFPIPWRQFCRMLIGLDISSTLHQNSWVGEKVGGNLYQLPLADSSVDVAILRYVLEHLERPAEALREVARVLRPGGRLLLLTPNRRHYVCLLASMTPHWFHRWFLARHGRFDEDVSPTRYRANTPGRLRELASLSGFRVVELELFEAAPGYLEWSWPAYLMGVAYERVVNRFEVLSGLRVSMLATLEKLT